MIGAGLAQCVEVGPTRLALGDPLIGELAGGDLLEDLLHLGLGGRGDDAGSAGHIAVLGGVGDRVPHAGDALLVHEIHDELHLMEAREVGHLRLVAGLGERLETSLHERRDAAAEHGLLAEEIGLGLLGEGGLDDSGAGSTDGVRVGERDVTGVAGGVLLDGDETGDAATLGVGATHEMTRSLGGGHHDIDAGGRHDAVEADVEAMGEEDGVAVGEVRGDLRLVHRLLLGVRKQDHDGVGPLRGLRDRHHGQALGLGLGLRGGTVAQADDHVDARFLEIQRMGMTLRAVADDGDLAIGDERTIGICFVVHGCHGGTPV